MSLPILSLTPGVFPGARDGGLIRVGRQRGLLDVSVVAIRDFSDDRYGTTDDYPYGGGAGMVMKAEPILRANESVRRETPGKPPRTLVTAPQGRTLTQSRARDLV